MKTPAPISLVSSMFDIPRLSAMGTASLSRTVLDVKPDGLCEDAEKAAEKLEIP